MYCRLLTGLKLWKTKSTSSFFSKGWTNAYFHWSANEPVCRERLMILVITGNRISMQPTTRGVGIGSNEQDFLGVASMSFWTSDSFNTPKLSIGCTTGESAKHFSVPGDTVVAMLLSLFCMTTILSAKNHQTYYFIKYNLVLKRRILSISLHAEQSLRYREKVSSGRHCSFQWGLCKTPSVKHSSGCLIRFWDPWTLVNQPPDLCGAISSPS